ncbi:hypothetical protein N182_32735 [Sinorhizobium sp. GL2]|nr:hypothetical protein N182_32735 [Sinorhizobium sp. GL2]
MASALADDLAEIVLRIAVLGDQLLVAKRFVERIEIRALDVFDDSDFKRRAIVNVANDNRDFGEPGQLCGTPAALAGDDLVAIDADGASNDRLDNTMLTDRIGEILEFGFVELTTRVARVARYELDRHAPIRIDRGRGSCPCLQRLIHLADQRGQSATKPPLRAIVVHIVTRVKLRYRNDYAALRWRSR